MMEPVVKIDRYAVSALPEDDINYKHWVLYVVRLANGKWVVQQGSGFAVAFLRPDGTWNWDGYRGDSEHHFDLDKALEMATKAVSEMKVNGFTLAEWNKRLGVA